VKRRDLDCGGITYRRGITICWGGELKFNPRTATECEKPLYKWGDTSKGRMIDEMRSPWSVKHGERMHVRYVWVWSRVKSKCSTVVSHEEDTRDWDVWYVTKRRCRTTLDWTS
jgi:hypothetical protein